MLPIPLIIVLFFTLRATSAANITVPHTSALLSYTSCQPASVRSAARQCGTNSSILLEFTGSSIALYGSPSPSNATAYIRLEFDNVNMVTNRTISPFTVLLYNHTARFVGRHRMLVEVNAGTIAFTRAIYDDGSNRTFSSASGFRSATQTSRTTPTSTVSNNNRNSGPSTIGIVVGCLFGIGFFLLVIASLMRRDRVSNHARNASESSPMLNRPAHVSPAVGAAQNQATRPARTRTDTEEAPPPYEPAPDYRQVP